MEERASRARHGSWLGDGRRSAAGGHPSAPRGVQLREPLRLELGAGRVCTGVPVATWPLRAGETFLVDVGVRVREVASKATRSNSARSDHQSTTMFANAGRDSTPSALLAGGVARSIWGFKSWATILWAQFGATPANYGGNPREDRMWTYRARLGTVDAFSQFKECFRHSHQVQGFHSRIYVVQLFKRAGLKLFRDLSPL
jgi:hypothetical protein